MHSKKTIKISEIFSFSFRIFFNHIELFFVSAIYAGSVLMLASVPFLFFTMENPFIVNVKPFIAGIFWFIYCALELGYRKIVLELLDRGESNATEIVSCFDKTALFCVIAGAIYFFLTLLGFILLIIPGIVVYIRCSLFPYFILDKKVGPVEALKMSWRITRGHFWRLLFIWLVIKLLLLLSTLTVFGLLIIVPWSIIVEAVIYRKLVPIGNERLSIHP